MASQQVDLYSTATPADADSLIGIDASDTTDSANGTVKRFLFSNFQLRDSDLTAIAALSTTSYGRSLLALADAAALRALAALVIGTDVQAFDAELAALAGLTSAANKGIQFTGSGTAATYDLTAAAKTILDDATIAAIRATLQIEGRTTFSNADYTGLVTDKYIAQVGTLSAVRTVTLPAANGVPAGYQITIADESGTITTSNYLTIARAGSDTVDGGTSFNLRTNYGRVDLISDGTSKWSYDVTGTARGGTGATTAAAARVNLGVDVRTAVSNAAYTILATDKYVAQTGTMSASRAFTLPAASALNPGQELIIADESGTVTGVNTIVVTRAGSDTIDGATTYTLGFAYGIVRLFSDGTSKWTTRAPEVVAEGRLQQAGTSMYSLPGVEASTASTQVLTAGQDRHMPIIVRTPITIDQLACEVTASGAGGTTIRMAIYSADVNWQPVALIVDSGTVTADSNAVKTASVSVTLQPGRYLLMCNSDGTPTLRSVRGGSALLGFTNTLGSGAFAASPVVTRAYAAFPSTPVASTAFTNSTLGTNYCVWVRESVP